MTNPCCGLAVIFCGFISLLIGRETINIPEIFSGVHGFTGTTVKSCKNNIIKKVKRIKTLSHELSLTVNCVMQVMLVTHGGICINALTSTRMRLPPL